MRNILFFILCLLPVSVLADTRQFSFQGEEGKVQLKMNEKKGWVQATMVSPTKDLPGALRLRFFPEGKSPVEVDLKLQSKEEARYEGKLSPMSGSYAAMKMEIRLFEGKKVLKQSAK